MAGEIITGYTPDTTQGADQLVHSGSSNASRRRHRAGVLFAAGLALAGVVAAAPAAHAEEAQNDASSTLSLPDRAPHQINNVCHVSVGTE